MYFAEGLIVLLLIFFGIINVVLRVKPFLTIVRADDSYGVKTMTCKKADYYMINKSLSKQYVFLIKSKKFFLDSTFEGLLANICNLNILKV